MLDLVKTLAGFQQGMAELGQHQMTWTEAQLPNRTQMFRGYCKMAGNRESEVVNAYGVDTRIVTLPGGVLPIDPKKLDEIQFDGMVLTVIAPPQPTMIGGVVFKWTLLCRGV